MWFRAASGDVDGMIAAAARIYRSIWLLHGRNIANLAGSNAAAKPLDRKGEKGRESRSEKSARRGRGRRWKKGELHRDGEGEEHGGLSSGLFSK